MEKCLVLGRFLLNFDGARVILSTIHHTICTHKIFLYLLVNNNLVLISVILCAMFLHSVEPAVVTNS